MNNAIKGCLLSGCREVGCGAAEGEQDSRRQRSGAQVPGQTPRHLLHAEQTLCLPGRYSGRTVSSIRQTLKCFFNQEDLSMMDV